MIDRYPRYKLPETVGEAVNLLMSDLTTQQMAAMGEMNNKEFDRLCNQLVPHLQHDLRLWDGNDRLLVSCFDRVDNDTSTDPMRIIMDEMRSRLQSLNDMVITV